MKCDFNFVCFMLLWKFQATEEPKIILTPALTQPEFYWEHFTHTLSFCAMHLAQVLLMWWNCSSTELQLHHMFSIYLLNFCQSITCLLIHLKYFKYTLWWFSQYFPAISGLWILGSHLMVLWRRCEQCKVVGGSMPQRLLLRV